MPNQNNSDPNTTNTNNTTPQPVGSSQPVSPVFPQSDLPPLPPDFQAVVNDNSVPTSVKTSNDQPINPTIGSAAPVSTFPPVISPAPKKKFGGGRIIATILGIFLLVGGLGAGLLLTQQQQLFQPKASGGVGYSCLNDDWCANGYGCGANGTCQGNPITDTCGRDSDPGAPVCCTDSCSSSNTVCEGSNRLECNQGGVHCTIDADGCIEGTPPEGNPPGGTTPPATTSPGPTAQCLNVTAYSSTWTALTSIELSALTVGTPINFCVAGSASEATFDKAMFKINSTLEAETTTKRPTSNDYCQAYTILSTDTTVSVQAKIHHTTLGWFGEEI